MTQTKVGVCELVQTAILYKIYICTPHTLLGGFGVKVSKLFGLIFMTGADVFSPDEAHLPPPSGSILFLQSLPSAHKPVCLRPSWWWSAWSHRNTQTRMHHSENRYCFFIFNLFPNQTSNNDSATCDSPI